MERVSDYLAWLGGADLVVLKQVPSERIRFCQMGLVLLNTASIAVISMYFAIHDGLDQNWAVSTVIGIFWGVIVLNLDRLMLLSMGRTRNRKHLLLTAIPSLSLSILVAFVVATPLVLRIFYTTISAQLTAMHRGNGILVQLQALSDLANGTTLIKFAIFTVVLLFIVIELLPITVKLLLNLAPMTAYERVADAREREELDRDLAASLNNLGGRYADDVSPSLINELLARQNAVLDRLESAAASPGPSHDTATREDEIMSLLQSQMTRLNDLVSAIPARGPQSALTESPSRDQVAYIQELAHSLNTPLSQIEAAALLLPDDSQENTVAASGSKTPAKRIYQSVEICKAFLAAFMQITNVASQTSKWNPKSLDASLRAAAELYADKARSGVESTIHIEVEPRGYPASYIMAVALPIIENAFESARPNSTISVRITAAPREYRIQVSSAYETMPEVDSMYGNGFTTKEGHQGVGLSVVQRLLSAYQGTRITHDIIDGQIGFAISLPRGRE